LSANLNYTFYLSNYKIVYYNKSVKYMGL